MCVWKGARSIAPYASRECRLHQLRMLGEDTEEIGACSHSTDGRAERQLAIARKSGGRVSTLAIFQKKAESGAEGAKGDAVEGGDTAADETEQVPDAQP